MRLDKSNWVTFVPVQVTPYQGEEHPVFIVQGVHKLSQFVKGVEVTIPFIKPIKYAASCASVLAAVDWQISTAKSANRMLSPAIMIWYVRDKPLNLGQ